MTKRSWLDTELGVGGALRQVGELLREGFRRPWLTLLVSALLFSAVAAAVAFSKQNFAPRFVLRVVEADRESSNAPRLHRDLAEYVRQASFTSEALFEVIRRHGLYPKLMRVNSRAALDSFREDIFVEVYQNYFLEDRAPGDLARSARVAVSYHCHDRELALAVTRDLGGLIVERELAARREQLLDAAAAADFTRDAAQRALRERSQELLTKESLMQQASAPDPRLQVELVGLLGSLGALQRRADTAERNSNAIDLDAALQRHGGGLHFEVVDAPALPSDREHQQMLLMLAASTVVFGVPLCALAIGAFQMKRETA
jgi:hypothetical protein